ncbi:MAG TPA: amidohydrolase [Desulfotomaculum sp.]|nr:amidohydrolase [Desulfotomaculum sp.]
MKLLIKGVTVIPVTGADKLIRDGAVAVRDGEIVYVGPSSGVPGGFDGAEVYGGADMVALPGFVNAHTHAAMTLFRSYADDLPLMKWLEESIWPLEAKLSGEDVYWGTLLACAEMLSGGTTTFADMYFFMDRVAQAVEECGIRASLSRGLIGIAPGAQAALAESREFIREWHGKAGGRITCMLGPHAPYTCPPDYLKQVISLAEELGVSVHIHVAETRQETDAIQKQYGCSPVFLLADTGLLDLPVLAAHCVHLSVADIEILARKGTTVAHSPESNMKLASGIAPVTRLLGAGVAVGLGTDGAASNNNLDMLEEMRSAALLQKVASGDPEALPAYAALEMATIGGARALGLGDKIGTIEVGKRADIILLNLRKPHLYPPHDVVAHVVYAAQAQDVDTVIVDGNVLVEAGWLRTVDTEAVMDNARRCARRLVGKPKERSLL